MRANYRLHLLNELHLPQLRWYQFCCRLKRPPRCFVAISSCHKISFLQLAAADPRYRQGTWPDSCSYVWSHHLNTNAQLTHWLLFYSGPYYLLTPLLPRKAQREIEKFLGISCFFFSLKNYVSWLDWSLVSYQRLFFFPNCMKLYVVFITPLNQASKQKRYWQALTQLCAVTLDVSIFPIWWTLYFSTLVWIHLDLL